MGETSTRGPNPATATELAAISDTLRATMNGDGVFRTLFMTGSAVTGEWAADHTPEGWVFYSDLDLGVICEHRDRETENRLRARLQTRLDELGHVRQWKSPPETKVAFFSIPELAAQAPKPGTLEMVNQGRVLWGDRAIRDHFPALTVEDLTWEEAIRLLGNRVIELMENAPEDEVTANDYYRLSKLFCDFATALLVPESAYVTGYRQRASRLPALLNDRPLPPRLSILRDRLIEAVEFWTDFRVLPDVNVLRERYRTEPTGDEGRGLYNGIWCEARILLGACLEALLPYRLLDERGRPEPAALKRASGWGSLRMRVREWRWLARYSGTSSAAVWRTALRNAVRRSPVEITYLSAFLVFMRGVDGPPPYYLDEDLHAALDEVYPIPHEPFATGEEMREGLIRLWRFWLPRI